MLREQFSGEIFIAKFDGLGHAQIERAAFHQQPEDFFVAKLAREHVRSGSPSEAININDAGAARILLGEIFLRDAHPDGLWIAVEMALN